MALINPGRTLTPARLAAMTKGEAVASEAEERSEVLVYGTSKPIEEDRENEEENDSVESLLDCCRDVLAWVLGLPGCNADEFRSLV